MNFFLVLFVIQFRISFTKQLPNDQREGWSQISKLLKDKEGKLPEYFRQYTPRFPDDSQQLVFPSLKESEVPFPVSVDVQDPSAPSRLGNFPNQFDELFD